MPIYYHAAPLPLGEGSIILPGNWGRILRFFGDGHSLWARETTFERVRADRFPDRPSRFDSTFCVQSREELRLYVDVMAKPTIPMVFYEVEPAEPDAPTHMADYGWLNELDGNTIDDRAVAYWSGTQNVVTWSDLPPGTRSIEVISASPLRVLRQLAD